MDSGLVAEPVIGPRDFARARWLGPGMTAASTRATRIAMANFMSHVAVPIAIGAVAIVLLLGLVNMMMGGSGNTSQKLMRLRVLLQAIAIGVIMLTLWFMGK
jgi:hypothetical protein